MLIQVKLNHYIYTHTHIYTYKTKLVKKEKKRQIFPGCQAVTKEKLVTSRYLDEVFIKVSKEFHSKKQ